MKAFKIGKSEEESPTQPAARCRLVPEWTLSGLLGDALAFNGRASFTNPGWIRYEPDVLDFMTGGSLCIAGDMPVLCSRSMVDPLAVRLLESGGLALGSRLLLYDDAASYQKLLQKQTRKWVVQHVHPESEIRPEQYWIPRGLLAFLNNKKHLEKLVTPACVPARRSVAQGRRIDKRTVKFPLVLKVATDESTGGCLAVRVCRDAAELDLALASIGKGHDLILETFMPIRRNECIQFAISRHGSVVYLGAAEQVIGKQGAYLGNWIDPARAPSPAAKLACTLVAERAARAGYRGIAGFDTAELEDGRVFVFDLNFRLNGSTLPLLFYRSLQQRYGKPVVRSRGWTFAGGYRQMLAHVERWSGEGNFVPFSLQRPHSATAPARTFGVFLGANRTQVTALARQWGKLGFA